jgi:3D (Asp-Asp-Asp) domain-containing protein
VIPLGSRLSIPGYGLGVATDTGGAIQGARIDIWFPTLVQARTWGTRAVTITVYPS